MRGGRLQKISMLVGLAYKYPVIIEAAVRHKIDFAVFSKGAVLRRQHTVPSVGNALKSHCRRPTYVREY